ncbi:MAG TPA: Flp pilus assembly protein CpaB [Terriglobales bacterium]|jgi:pilus assembly protein CpaB|nr:Flp pilus assembly protein CpaB [Terriglobales bacterium]
MNRNRLLLIGILALGVGALVSYMVYTTLRRTVATVKQANTQVVVAAIDLQVGARLEDKDLREVRLPGADLPQGYYQNKADVLGRGVVVPIAKGEFILPSKLAAENAGAGLPSLIPPGMRAVSVRVNEVVAVAGFVIPGTRVDVLLTGNPRGTDEPLTTTVLENVEVLAAGQKLQRSSQGEPQSVPVITLLVSPEDAQKLTMASNEGRIQLALRNPLDTSEENLAVLRDSSLYRVAGPVRDPQPTRSRVRRVAAAPKAAPAPSMYVVEMIKGDKRDVSKF